MKLLYDLNLITSNEKAAEQKAVEKYLGINRAVPAAKTVPATRVEVETQIEEVVTPRANAAINTVEKETTVETIDVPATGTTATTLPGSAAGSGKPGSAEPCSQRQQSVLVWRNKAQT